MHEPITAVEDVHFEVSGICVPDATTIYNCQTLCLCASISPFIKTGSFLKATAHCCNVTT